MFNEKVLIDLKAKDKAIIFKILDFDIKQKNRLIEMGFVKNQKIEVVKNFKKTKTMIVLVRGYTLALDYFLAKNIIVSC